MTTRVTVIYEQRLVMIKGISIIALKTLVVKKINFTDPRPHVLGGRDTIVDKPIGPYKHKQPLGRF